jgi:regulation of enolase protein 1 (concanavalin A-like superfamily)
MDVPSTGVWLRLSRNGNTFTGLYSDNGLVWNEIGRVEISMAGTVRAGMLVSSGVPGVLAGASFSTTRVVPKVDVRATALV